MNIQKNIKVLTFILVVFVAAQCLGLQAPSQAGSGLEHFNLSDDQKNPDVQTDIKRSLQAVAVSSSAGAVLNPISNSKFQGLTIYNEIPSNWVIGQVFQVRGRLNSPAMSDQTLIIFAFISTNSASKKDFRAVLSAGQSEFTISVNTKSMQAGTYYLALYPGLSGSYSTSTVYTLQYPGSEYVYNSAPGSPDGCSMNFQNNQIVLRWNEDGLTPLERIVFVQGSNVVEYILSNFQSSFVVPLRDFASFSSGYVTVTVASAYSSQISAGGRNSPFSPFPWSFVFRAGAHSFVNEPVRLSLQIPIPDRVSIGTSVRIIGTSLETIYNEVVIEEPQKFIRKVKLISSSSSKYLNPGAYFDTTIYLDNEGVYIVQINSDRGEALLLKAIYVGDFYPILPDLVDMDQGLTNQEIIAAQPQGDQNLRNALLSLINQKRQEWGRAPLTIDANLNNLAYGHSYDMMTRGYFSHSNFEGDRVQQRATKAGLFYPVGQNIAQGLDLAEVHFRLAKSPGHLFNIVNENYTRVGFGIVRGSNGDLHVTQNYAGPLQNSQPSPQYQNPTPIYQNPTPIYQDPTPTYQDPTPTYQSPQPQASGSSMSASQIENLRIQIRNWISNAYPTAVEDPVLSNIVKNWLNTGMSQTIFDYTWDTNNYPTTGLSASSVSGPYDVGITNYFTIGSHLAQPDSTYTKFGVGVLLLPDNSLKIQVEYAQ